MDTQIIRENPQEFQILEYYEKGCNLNMFKWNVDMKGSKKITRYHEKHSKQIQEMKIQLLNKTLNGCIKQYNQKLLNRELVNYKMSMIKILKCSREIKELENINERP